MSRALFGLPISEDRRLVIGVVHLLPLPGSPRAVAMNEVLTAARRDSAALIEGGVDAMIVENLGDAPFHPASVPAVTVAAMTRVLSDLRDRVTAPLGVNVLRNDGVAALAAAHAVGAEFIRVNVLCGARLADQGLLHGIAHALLRERARLGAELVSILADVDVKHSAPLASYSREQEVADVLQRGGADAVIVSGPGTGRATDPAEVREVRDAAAGKPVLVGSGVTAAGAAALREFADGFIVGTAFKRGGRLNAPVDPARVRSLVEALR